ncbi:molybdate ABC transporter permease subunit [Ferviditalea candida]|uniref:Molybdenum transport system permease n=1 Tax=Ferviditalea candida TaxID=3108399 RepID=A0ABU5ZM56_9BACL|nr:molybdate ABC transporter permease subunit [Paenibacillaceae bacterium T2]
MNSIYEFVTPIQLSIRITAVSSILVFILGVPAAWWMTRKPFRGKVFVENLLMLPLVLPPTVIGFILLLLLGKNSILGRFAEWLFDQPIIFSWWAAVIASVVVAFPLVYQTMKVGFSSIDKELEDAGRSIGANEWQVFFWITFPLAWRSLLSAYILGFGRGLGEFGATLMIAGNIPGRTQTVPTAIYLAVDTGNMTFAWWWTGSIMLISFLILLLVSRTK